MRFVDLGKSTVLTRYQKHKHNQFEISLVLQGYMNVKIGEKIARVSEGDVMIIPADTYHEGTDGDNYMDIFLKAENMDFCDNSIIHDYDGSIKKLFLMIKKASSEKETNYLNITDKLLEAMWEYIKKYIEKNFKYDFVVNIKNKIYDNLSNPDFNITKEVQKIGFNIDYFRRCFREELSCTPLEYMTRLRIEQAEKLLIQRTFKSVENVSLLCGFSDNFYFSKIFKKHTGLSPRDYRKKYMHK